MERRRTVLTVGNFDGVHVGHAALLAEARRIADASNADVTVLTFQQHPLTTLKPSHAPKVLTDPAQRMGLLLDAGADRVEWLQPSADLLGLTPDQFVQQIVDRYKPLAIIEGANFRFGRHRAGDTQRLGELGSELGFEVRVVEPVVVTLRDKTQAPVSSSLIRWMIDHGRMADAHLCLGRPYVVRGPVIEGDRRGRTIGFPTVNLDVPLRQLPADGVYGGTVRIDRREHLAAVSVGHKPTFGPHARAFEAFILDFDGDLYGRTLDIAVIRWLRGQAAFPSVQSLVEQMRRDVGQIRRLAAAGLLAAADLVIA